MALNPFFLHGTSSEQRLVQDLINEQLRMYGVEVVYIPRKFVNKKQSFKKLLPQDLMIILQLRHM